MDTATKLNSDNCVVGIRPEDIQVHLSAVQKEAGMNVLKGTVVDFTDLGHIVAVTCDVGRRFVAIIIKSVFMEMNLEEEQKVWLVFKSSAVKVIE